jgi:hypothetical protein
MRYSESCAQQKHFLQALVRAKALCLRFTSTVLQNSAFTSGVERAILQHANAAG